MISDPGFHSHFAPFAGFFGFASVSRGCASTAGVSFVMFDMCFLLDRVAVVTSITPVERNCKAILALIGPTQGRPTPDPEQLACGGPFL